MRIVQSGKGRTYIQWEKLSQRLSFFCGMLLENRKEVGRWKRLVKMKVAEGLEAEICSGRKDERRREILAYWRLDELTENGKSTAEKKSSEGQMFRF